ncbi:hypothetical protein PGT21_000409 [Puccinia graminis f. sp. tritici]|uniref:Uncharacterized protein n=1 Tax=Puccinia graminis f. sp. tritici TaxID=56615 RepID=A0A5B0MXM1_PUCGR|nr:hypothetical protein PGT21_000409 [Puccinia graminis f. sp. tritici]
MPNSENQTMYILFFFGPQSTSKPSSHSLSHQPHLVSSLSSLQPLPQYPQLLPQSLSQPPKASFVPWNELHSLFINRSINSPRTVSSTPPASPKLFCSLTNNLTAPSCSVIDRLDNSFVSLAVLSFTLPTSTTIKQKLIHLTSFSFCYPALIINRYRSLSFGTVVYTAHFILNTTAIYLSLLSSSNQHQHLPSHPVMYNRAPTTSHNEENDNGLFNRSTINGEQQTSKRKRVRPGKNVKRWELKKKTALQPFQAASTNPSQEQEDEKGISSTHSATQSNNNDTNNNQKEKIFVYLVPLATSLTPNLLKQ